MKLRYVGESFGFYNGLTDGQIYECLGIEGPLAVVRIIDDSIDDEPYEISGFDWKPGYLYSLKNPAPLDPEEGPGGHWEVVEDDESGTLAKALKGVA